MLRRRDEAAGERPFNNLLRRLNDADFARFDSLRVENWSKPKKR